MAPAQQGWYLSRCLFCQTSGTTGLLLCARSINSGLQTAALLRGKRKQGLSYCMPLDEREKESMNVLNTTGRKGKLIRNKQLSARSCSPRRRKVRIGSPHSTPTIRLHHTPRGRGSPPKPLGTE